MIIENTAFTFDLLTNKLSRFITFETVGFISSSKIMYLLSLVDKILVDLIFEIVSFLNKQLPIKIRHNFSLKLVSL